MNVATVDPSECPVCSGAISSTQLVELLQELDTLRELLGQADRLIEKAKEVLGELVASTETLERGTFGLDAWNALMQALSRAKEVLRG